MKTPIYDFLNKYADSDTLRLHMPGHKGNLSIHPLASDFQYDITEIHGADSLYEASGIILESEQNATSLFGTKRTIYSTQGSTLGIQTMLAAVAPTGSTVIAPRNAHRAFVNTCALLGLDVEWVMPDDEFGLVSFEYTADDIEKAFCRSEKASCVYITSPDYYGRLADIEGISAVCRRHGIPLLVDNAHGAHLAFTEKNRHPIALGADMCCDSAHKTLPVLTGGAYVHIGNEKYIPLVKEKMALFGSSSPSYLILCSLDLCNDYIERSIKNRLVELSSGLTELKEWLSPAWSFIDGDFLHLTVEADKSGLSGTELAEILRQNAIECEFADESCTVLLFSSVNSNEDINKLYEIMKSVRQPKIRIERNKIPFQLPEKAMSIRKATLAPNENISVDDAVGRICGITHVTCPPCIPVVIAGERIDKNCVNILKKYSILELNVVK